MWLSYTRNKPRLMFPLTSPFTACSRRSCTSYEVQMETEATACVENTIIMTVAFTTQVGPDPPPFSVLCLDCA